jgi:putative nucleotidyltransferase with HDIG domain
MHTNELTSEANIIDINQLQVGLYVHLDLGWMDHPFTLSNFKVKNEEQIYKIKSIGLKKLRYDPKRSDCTPLPIDTIANKKPIASSEKIEERLGAIASNQPIKMDPKVERLVSLHALIEESEKKFVIASDIAQHVTNNLIHTPKECIKQTTQLVSDMVDTALMEGDVAIHALNGTGSSDKNYQQALNVTVLSLMMAKSIEMSKEDLRLLGMAAMFHDIGKAEIASNILNKEDPLTKSEQAHYEMHSEIGARIAQEVGLPSRVGKIILQHHEHADGSGYPDRLKADEIDPLARLVALANCYDDLCNPQNPALSKTPYEALAFMYAHQRSKYDEALLKHLIKELGIYPPGSIVQLSSGVHGIIISSNPSKPLRPYVMVHDPLVNRQSPRIIDLRDEPKINILSCLRANQLPLEVTHYLNPRTKISYFIEVNSLNDGKEEV